ncbi:phage major capsid protein [Miltoncostaea marina]|uniref:phage major capsid protein n=1 Tax=Miltoncostaea marina TaxID=2843215 RepID=UPI001C3CF0BE|nr:phage major capsid protein [Miltoncostaea marina]
MNPALTAPPDPVRDELRADVDRLTNEAKERWAAFAKRRGEVNADLTPEQLAAEIKSGGSPEFKELHELHAAFEASSKMAEQAQERWIAHLEGGSRAARPAPGQDLAKSVIENFRGTNGQVGAKALLAGTAVATLPGFFDDALRLLPQAGTFLRSLVQVKPADGPQIAYLQQTVATHNAAAVAPTGGAQKPTSIYTIDQQTTPAVWIAHLTEPIDRAILLDWQQAQSFIQSQMILGVLLELDAQMLSGDGTAPDFEGILTNANINTAARATGETYADAIHRGITEIRLDHIEPEAVVIHPSDLEVMRLDKTSDGAYLAGPMTEGEFGAIWGKRAVPSTVIPEGTALVGAFRQGATLYEVDPVRFEVSDQHSDLFGKNQVVGRAELRAGFGIDYPEAFCKVDLTEPAP